MKTINIPTSYGNIIVDVANKGGAVTLPPVLEGEAYDAALDAFTSLILAHACAGVDVGNSAYAKGVNVALEAIANQD